jgi:hypothetical protein
MLIMLFAIGAIASETVTKNSAVFSFPTTVGVVWKNSTNGKDPSFVSQTHYAGKKVVELSWFLSGQSDKGYISVFNLAGSRIKTFRITSREGSVQWDATSGTRIAKGIYFAKLVCGTFTKNLRIILN